MVIQIAECIFLTRGGTAEFGLCRQEFWRACRKFNVCNFAVENSALYMCILITYNKILNLIEIAD